MSLKDDMIFALERSRDRFISGQEMAAGRKVTRSAVWKCVNALKAEGYEIISQTNAGYKLAPGCNVLSAPGIRAHLAPGLGDTEIVTFKTIDSTNNEAKRRNANGQQGECIIAASGQTAGRGRRGRSFYSPPGSGIYFTFMFPTEQELADATAVTTAAAVAVAEALAKHAGADPRIKWVNDVFIGGKKVCGILSEAVSDFESGAVQAIIVGIGINLSTTEFPPEIAGTAGNADPRGLVNKNALIADVYTRLKGFIGLLPARDYMRRYRELSAVLGNEVTFERNGEAFCGVAKEILDDGALTVETAGGVITLRSGEVSIRLK